MNEALLKGANVVVQGITGAHGAFHASAMKAAGTHVVAGVSPKKAGELVDGIPVYASVKDIQANMDVDISVIFVPAIAAKGAIIEAIGAKVPLIVCITEGIPIHDMLQISQHLQQGSSRLIGPNCPGILLPGGNKLGIIPASLSLPFKPSLPFSHSDAMQGAGEARNEPYKQYGDVSTGTSNAAERRETPDRSTESDDRASVWKGIGIVSRSGTLTYEAMDSLTRRGIGQKYIIGIGGDRIAGTSFIDCLELFQNDPDVDRIIMIGEIGGTSELEAADYIAQHVTKPVYAYITGHHAPAGVQLGHAGAILGSADESANAKTTYLSERGVTTATNITSLISKL
jgi:succinyl-CoA synthetase alpha subunit